MNGFKLNFVSDEIDSNQFKNFLKSTPPMTKDFITGIPINLNVPTWIFYPLESDPTLRDGKIEQDDVSIMTFHEGHFGETNEEMEDIICEPLAAGTFNGKVGYWKLEMRGTCVPEFFSNPDYPHKFW